MAIENYTSCNELDNLQHNGQNVSTLNTATHSTLLSLYEPNLDVQVFFRQIPLALRCSSHDFLATPYP